VGGYRGHPYIAPGAVGEYVWRGGRRSYWSLSCTFRPVTALYKAARYTCIHWPWKWQVHRLLKRREILIPLRGPTHSSLVVIQHVSFCFPRFFSHKIICIENNFLRLASYQPRIRFRLYVWYKRRGIKDTPLAWQQATNKMLPTAPIRTVSTLCTLSGWRTAKKELLALTISYIHYRSVRQLRLVHYQLESSAIAVPALSKKRIIPLLGIVFSYKREFLNYTVSKSTVDGSNQEKRLTISSQFVKYTHWWNIYRTWHILCHVHILEPWTTLRNLINANFSFV
jgi:hypothetical protein